MIFTKQFWVIAGLYFSFGFCRSTFLVHTPVHVQDIGFSLNDGANVMAALSLSSIAGRIGMGRVADILGNKFAFMSSYALTAMALIWALITNQLWGMYLFAIVFGLGWGAQAVLRFLVTSEAFGLASLGLLIGVLGISEAVAGALGLYYAGYIFDIAGEYSRAFWLGIAISGIGAVFAGLYKPVTKRWVVRSR
jgi:MFS family permease